MASNESEIDDKLDYLADTKTLIRQAITNKGATVTDNTTFRAYADIINNLVVETDQSDATVTANDMVAGKIAYNNNNKVIGNLTEYMALTSEAIEVIDVPNNNKLIAKAQTDTRTLLGKNANINLEVSYNSIPDYQDALYIAEDILGLNEEADAEEAFNVLNNVTNTPLDTYEGMGGTYAENMVLLQTILGE